jgi:hypothetical protein
MGESCYGSQSLERLAIRWKVRVRIWIGTFRIFFIASKSITALITGDFSLEEKLPVGEADHLPLIARSRMHGVFVITTTLQAVLAELYWTLL